MAKSKLRGQRGQTGATGKIGKAGARGAKGATGPAGPPGKSGNDPHVLAAVHDQIDRIHRDLEVQLKRMGQLQVEIDEVRTTVKRLMGTQEKG